MNLRIGNESSLTALLQSRQRQEGALSKLASGKRVEKAADDAAAMSIGARLAALEAALNQGTANVADGIGAVQIAEGGLSGMSDSLIRMREISVQAQNGTLNDADRAALQQEYDQLSAEVDRVAQSTGFNGQNLLDGSLGGSNGLRLEDGTGGEGTRISIGDHGAAALGIAGRSVGDSGTLDALDKAMSRVSSTRSSLGAMTNSLQSRTRQLQNTSQNVAESRSRLIDADVAKEASTLAREKIKTKGALAMLSQRGLQAGSVLRLLG